MIQIVKILNWEIYKGIYSEYGILTKDSKWRFEISVFWESEFPKLGVVNTWTELTFFHESSFEKINFQDLPKELQPVFIEKFS